jgi:hypothetical protein
MRLTAGQRAICTAINTFWLVLIATRVITGTAAWALFVLAVAGIAAHAVAEAADRLLGR